MFYKKYPADSLYQSFEVGITLERFNAFFWITHQASGRVGFEPGTISL